MCIFEVILLMMLRHLLLILIFTTGFAQKVTTPKDLHVHPTAKYVHIYHPYDGIDKKYYFDEKGREYKYIGVSSIILNHTSEYKRELKYFDNQIIKEEQYYNNTLKYVSDYKYEGDKLLSVSTFDKDRNTVSKYLKYQYISANRTIKITEHDDKSDFEIIFDDPGSNLLETAIFDDDRFIEFPESMKIKAVN